MHKRGLMLGLLALATQALAEDGRYEALPLAVADGGKGGGRALILDTRDGHVWVWSENELLTYLAASAVTARALFTRASCARVRIPAKLSNSSPANRMARVSRPFITTIWI